MPVWLSVPHPCFDNKRLPGWKHSCCSGASLQKMKPLRWKLAFQHISTLNNVSGKYATKFVESEFVSCKTFEWTFRGFSRSNRVPNIFLGSPVSPRLFWSSIYQEMWKWSQSSMQCVCVWARSIQDSFLWQASRHQQSDLFTKSETSNKTKSINYSSWRHTFLVHANNIHRNNHIQFDHV